MRVLDIDLDFFLADCCPLALSGSRPELLGHEPWDDDAVESYLINNLGLDANVPLPGRIFETHDKALFFWHDLIERGELTVPFSVVHVDAHSDLGIGKPGPGYVLNTVLAQPCAVRCDSFRHYEMHQLDEANYLLFALAYRWVDDLVNVRNPRSRNDIPSVILTDSTSDEICLNSFTASLMEGKNGKEPHVPFHVYSNPFSFQDTGCFDYVSLAISPRYAPKEADRLIPLFRRYIREI